MAFDQFIWLLFIGITFVSAYTMKSRTQSFADMNPELEKGYKDAFRAMIFFGNLPWLVMGAGILSGQVKGVSGFFGNNRPGPFTLAFFAVIIADYLVLVWWIFRRGGAEFLEKHPGIIRSYGSEGLTAKQVKQRIMITAVAALVAIVFVVFGSSKK